MLKKMLTYYKYLREFGFWNSLGNIGHEVKRKVSHPRSLRGFPDSLHIEITDTCNLDCEYCVLRSHSSDKKIMPLETFEVLKPYVKYVRNVALSGLAEPLLNRNVISILQTIKTLSPHCHVSMISNATLLTRELSERFIHNKLDFFGFSLDGTDANLIDKIRKGSSLNRVIENINILNEIRHQRKTRFPIICATTVLQRKNYSQLPEIVELASELGVARLEINGLEPYTEDMLGNEIWYRPGSHENLSSILLEAFQRARKRHIDLRFAHMIPKDPICPTIATPIILANGDVVPCSVLAYKRDFFYSIKDDMSIERENGIINRKCFGNIHESGLDDIWFSPEYSSFREKVQAGMFPRECRNCLIKHGIICVREHMSAKDIVGQIKRDASVSHLSP